MSDAGLLLITATLVVAVWQGVGVAALALSAGLLLRQRPLVLLLCAVAAVLGAWLGAWAWEQAAPRQLGDFTGWAEERWARAAAKLDGPEFEEWLGLVRASS